VIRGTFHDTDDFILREHARGRTLIGAREGVAWRDLMPRILDMQVLSEADYLKKAFSSLRLFPGLSGPPHRRCAADAPIPASAGERDEAPQ
jgi:hypothetical protein